MSDEFPTKAAVSVAEMARMCGLSRARFYQLQKAGVFPPPARHPESGRPFYTEELQKLCLEVRRRNCGVNGKPVLFYTRRQPLARTSPKRRKTKAGPTTNDLYGDLAESLKSLGLTQMTATLVEAAVAELFPQGMSGVNQAEVVRAVFLHRRRKYSGRKPTSLSLRIAASLAALYNP